MVEPRVGVIGPETVSGMSYRELVSDASEEIAKLVKLEVALAKEELRVAMKRQTRSIALLAGGGVFAFANFVLLAWGAIYAIALVLPLWAAVLIVAGAGLLVGLGLMAAGRAGLDPAELKPAQTMVSARNSVRYLVNRVKPQVAAEGAAAARAA
jgi:hypothetical protein